MKRLIYFIMALLGFGAVSCDRHMMEYGCPTADYRVSARVVDNDGNPIEGIEVTGSYRPEIGVSDADGNVYVEYLDISHLYEMIFRDVDGEENGGEFEDVELTWEDFRRKLVKVEEGKGWYEGVYELKLGDVKMTLKSEENTEENE